MNNFNFIIFTVLVCFLFVSSFVHALLYDFETKAQEKDWKVFSGKGEIVDGKYILEKTDGPDGIAAIGDMSWTDCTVTCTATMLPDSADNMGFVWRLENGKMFYTVGLRLDQRTGFCGCINGAWMNGGSPINPKPFNTKVDREYKLELVAQGNSSEFFLDGESMGKWEDDQLATGMVGIRVWQASMAVDDFDINGPGIPPSAVDGHGKIAITWGKIRCGKTTM